MCMNYRKLKAVTIRDTYTLPQMDPCIESLRDAVVLSTLDASWGYFQISMVEKR